MKFQKLFSSPSSVFTLGSVLRLGLLVYGHFQDQFSALKYTDIDYYVFTDASRYVSFGKTPYLRDTYRYTPLLAWILVPTSLEGLWFDFGKVIFAASDIIAGWLTFRILRDFNGMDVNRALKFSCLWTLNPMVAQISTRGSSEGLLAVLVMAILWATLERKYTLAGMLLGFSVHFKIYPFIYAFAIFLWIGGDTATSSESLSRSDLRQLSSLVQDLAKSIFSKARIKLTLASAITFALLNLLMFLMYEYRESPIKLFCILTEASYGRDFVHHTFLYHLSRTDHRHNFSVYNTLLYLNSYPGYESGFRLERLAFIPQIFLSAFAIPLVLAKQDLASCMLIQTMTFVTFNKVCTSQYFLWYMVFLPFYLPSSSFITSPRKGVVALILWIVGQAVWLQQGYQLEFLGKSTFFPGLFGASLLFFVINIWILNVMIYDVRVSPGTRILEVKSAEKKTQ